MRIAVKFADGAALVSVRDQRDGSVLPFGFVGASVPTSALPGEMVSQLSVFPSKEEGAVVIVDCQGVCWAFRLTRDGEKLIFDSDSQGTFFNPERSGQSYCGSSAVGRPGWLEVQVGKHRFTSNPSRVKEATHFVADVNLLCRYWAGSASYADVLAVASEHVREKSRVIQIGELRRKLTRAEKSLKAWSELARDLASRLQARWFLGKEDHQLLRHDLLWDLSGLCK